MKRLNLYFLLILFLLLGCKKKSSERNNTSLFVQTQYKMYDSVIRQIDNMNGGGIISENHFALNRNIDIYKNNTSGEIIYSSDTFVIYQNSPLTYSNKNSSFPLLKFNNDTLSIYRHLGGVALQTWEFLICVKY